MRTESVEALAAVQHGLVTRSQALRAGLTTGQLRGRLECGRWIRVYRNVYRVEGSPVTDVQRLQAAVLAAGDGAVASHRSAAWLWGLRDEMSLAVTVPKNRSPRLPGVAIHRQHVPSCSTSRRRGVAVTNPLRTLLDLAAMGHHEILDQALDRGIATRLFTVTAVEAELTRESRCGRCGTALLRERLQHRDAPSSRPPSVLESRFSRLVLTARLPLPHREYRVMDGAYRLDFAWPEMSLAVELDGYATHSSTEAFRADRTRQNALVAAGWTVLRFTWDDVCEQSEEVATHIRAAMAACRPA